MYLSWCGGPTTNLFPKICQHLSLRDLLNLSRTNKAFGVFLSGQNMMQVWKVAASNVEGLPACPPYMNEIQYARLLYLNYCHVRPLISSPFTFEHGLTFLV